MYHQSQRRQFAHHRSGVRLADCERGRQVGKATDMGHSRSGEIPIGDKIVLSRSSRSSLVYDATSRDSFNALTNWLNDARTLASPNIVILLVGNKKDLEEARDVTFLEASTFAQENGLFFRILHKFPIVILRLFVVAELIFLETSAKTGRMLKRPFSSAQRPYWPKLRPESWIPSASAAVFSTAELLSVTYRHDSAASISRIAPVAFKSHKLC